MIATASLLLLLVGACLFWYGTWLQIEANPDKRIPVWWGRATHLNMPAKSRVFRGISILPIAFGGLYGSQVLGYWYVLIALVLLVLPAIPSIHHNRVVDRKASAQH